MRTNSYAWADHTEQHKTLFNCKTGASSETVVCIETYFLHLTFLADSITRYADKCCEAASPYLQPLPYFVHRLQVEQEIIAKKECRLRMINKKPPNIIQQVCHLPCLNPPPTLVSEQTECTSVVSFKLVQRREMLALCISYISRNGIEKYNWNMLSRVSVEG